MDIEIIILICLDLLGFSFAMFCFLKILLCEYFDVDRIVAWLSKQEAAARWEDKRYEKRKDK